MKGEVSKNAITFLVVLLLLVSVIGAGSVAFSLTNTNSDISNPDIDKGTVGAYVGVPPASIGMGTVGLTVST
ncbi:MAG: hypothetical protein ABIF08_01070 [Nanoarchaeota archaeon]